MRRTGRSPGVCRSRLQVRWRLARTGHWWPSSTMGARPCPSWGKLRPALPCGWPVCRRQRPKGASSTTRFVWKPFDQTICPLAGFLDRNQRPKPGL